MSTRLRVLVPVFVALIATFPSAQAADLPGPSSPDAAMAQLHANTGGRIDGRLAPETGAYDFVRALRPAVLHRDSARARPLARALDFLRRYGAVAGMSAAERASLAGASPVLAHKETTRDLAGNHHVRFEQTYRGVDVFGAQLVVHVGPKGVTGLSGQFVPGITIGSKPKVSLADASRAAVLAVEKEGASAVAGDVTLNVYRVGLVEGVPGRNALAWGVEVARTEGDAEHVWVDAEKGGVLSRIPLVHSARDRRVYSPEYRRSDPDMFVWRSEGESDTGVPMFDRLYRYSGQVYDFFSKTFGRDSFDAKGHTMRTVYLVNQRCPNAYWNGSSTNYCPGFDTDDVVAHEWGHAYTEHTQGLIYFCQPGALNESYSDIWGETIDLLNGEDEIGGSANDRPYPDGRRWLVGEDMSDVAQEVLLRDMWDPPRLASPGKVSDPEYVCGTGDGGGVHTNSGVPNHAYAMLVDGKTFNGVTVPGIGLTKAAHIYYQAMTHYQTPSTKFPTHRQALLASCGDLAGINLPELMTGTASGKVIGAADCAAVAAAAKAVELHDTGVKCNFQPMFSAAVPELCPGATMHMNETFADGTKGWTLGSQGADSGWPDFKWRAVDDSPGGHAGKVAYAVNSPDGTCEAGDDYSGTFWMDSPPVAVPASAANVKLRFRHYMAAEYGFDGGNVKVSVNGGAFNALPQSAYIVNAPTAPLTAATPVIGGNTNPMAGQQAWTGANGGDVTGSWGTTVADLTGSVSPGDSVVVRFEFGTDCGSGWDGWYVDDVQVYSCPVLPAPEVTIKGGSLESEATSYTVQWTRPSGAVGPDLLQESTIACLPLVLDPADSLDNWDLSTEGSGAQNWEVSSKPEHDSSTFHARGIPAAVRASSIMTLKKKIALKPGTTTLTFADWHANEGDDEMRVEVSKNGGSWLPVYNKTRADPAPVSLLGEQTEPMNRQVVDLSPYSGSTIGLRFRYSLGPDDRAASMPVGWYVDDVRLVNDAWTTVATVPGTSYAIAGKPASGTYCYRVAGGYRIGGRSVHGDFSAPAGVKVKASAVAVKGARVNRPAPLPATGAGDGAFGASVLLAMCALLARVLRRRHAGA